MAVRYRTVRLNFCLEVRYAGMVRFFCDGTVRWYGTLFVMVQVRYVGTLFELKILDFSHIAPAFCMQRHRRSQDF